MVGYHTLPNHILSQEIMYIDGTVVKIASRCNLNCKYCYIYNKGDDTYKKQDKFMSNEVIEEFAKRVERYVVKYHKKKFFIVFHGGEPMLAGQDRIRFFINTLNTISADVEILYAIQTNGTLIDASWRDFFAEFKINVGISIDGTKDSNDYFRIYKNGKSSYSKIVNGITTMQVNDNNVGVLTVIDTSQNPIDVYNHYKTVGIKDANLLFPDDNFDDDFIDDLSLGKWLSEIYDIWNKDEDSESVNIQQFIKLTGLMLGFQIADEYYGKGKPNTFILETNGEFQANDPIRVCKDGMSKTDLNVFENEIDELFELPIAFLYYNNHQLLSEKCNKCPINDICGGGYVINRYSKKKGFDNPSIYCKSLAYFICHVQNVLLDTLESDFIREKGIKYLNFDDLLLYLNEASNVENPFLQSFR